MIFPQDLILALFMAVGIIGTIIQIIPGTLIILGTILVWTIITGGAAAWWIFVFALVVALAGMVLKFVLAGTHLKRQKVSNSSIIVGLVAGTIGFFVIPVLGLPLGFVLGVYLSELSKSNDPQTAKKATIVALKATGITILVELAAGLVMTILWIVGLVIT